MYIYNNAHIYIYIHTHIICICISIYLFLQARETSSLDLEDLLSQQLVLDSSEPSFFCSSPDIHNTTNKTNTNKKEEDF